MGGTSGGEGRVGGGVEGGGQSGGEAEGGGWEVSDCREMASPGRRCVLGCESDGRGEQAKSILALEKEAAADPNNVDTWIRLGNLYFDTDNFENAIRTYEKALSLKPDNANVQTDLGVMYRRNGQPKKAVEAFDRAIKIDPKHEVSRFNKGIVLLHDLSDKEGALRAWEELLSVNPTAMTPSGQPLKDLLKRFKETPGG